MSKWFYYNESGDKIEVTGGQLKWLAKNGKIAPGTLVETEDGKKALAKQVKGLTFIAAEQPETAMSKSATPEAKNSGLSQSPKSPVEVNPFATTMPVEVNPFMTPVNPLQPPSPASPFPTHQFTQPSPYASAQLVIYRPSAWYGRVASYDVFVNGQKLPGAITNEQTVTFPVPAGMLS